MLAFILVLISVRPETRGLSPPPTSPTRRRAFKYTYTQTPGPL